MPHVFISYSRKDTAFVDRLEIALRAEGILTWRDIHSIPGGAKWFRRIKQGLEASFAMLYVDTQNAEQSDWVEKEFLFAASLNLPIIPVKPDPNFRSLATINLNPIVCDDAHFVVGVGKIIAQLRSLPQKPVVPGAVAPPEPEHAETPAADTEDPGALDFSAEIADYVRWLLVKSQADLRDALYVSLAAQPEAPRLQAGPDHPLGFGLDIDLDLGFKRLDLERIKGEDFDKNGEPVADARVPVKEARRVVLLGEPGAGKTTTLQQLAVDLARALQTDRNAPIPVFVPLRQFDGKTDFEAFVRAQMYNLQDGYTQIIAHHEVIFLLDALNEMPRRSETGIELLPQVVEFTEQHQRWVLSCRVRDYQEELSAVADVSKIRLQPLDPPRIYDVIQRRFREQFAPQRIATAEDGESLWKAMYGTADLLKAWDVFVACGKVDAFWGAAWPDEVKPEAEKYTWNTPGYYDWQGMQRDKRRMLPLCRNPYMVKMVTDLYALDKSLPDNRGALFKKFVDKLLERDRRLAEQIGAAWLDDKLIRAGLAQIAYALERETEMTRADAGRILAEYLPGVDHDLLLRLAMGASLLEVGASVRFTHQLLQEYFASEVLGALVDAGTDPRTLWQPGNWWQANGREETLIILAGVRGDPEGVAHWVAPAQPELAYQVLTDSGVAVTLDRLDAATRQALVASANDKTSEPDPRGRAAAYRVLGLLDADTRPGIGVIVHDGVKLPDIDWVPIPGGEFLMGSDKDKDPKAYDDEVPRRKVTLPSFEMSRYPITYAQFQAFLDDSQGYQDTGRWFEGLAADEDDKQIQAQYFKYGNHPRETVNWYQAVAFCRWLSWRLGGGYDLKKISAWAVRLPTEQEWEKAARGTDGRIYPYGNTFDAGKGNVWETGIRQTSAVGIFPDENLPYGLQDMSGNVWEWCLTDYDKPAPGAEKENMRSNARRVLRGGSGNFRLDFARAAYRDFDLQYDRYAYLGFRVCRPPSNR